MSIRHTLSLVTVGAAAGIGAVACQTPAGRRVIHTVEPITVEPIYIRQDVNVKIEKQNCATSQPVQAHE